MYVTFVFHGEIVICVISKTTCYFPVGRNERFENNFAGDRLRTCAGRALVGHTVDNKRRPMPTRLWKDVVFSFRFRIPVAHIVQRTRRFLRKAKLCLNKNRRRFLLPRQPPFFTLVLRPRAPVIDLKKSRTQKTASHKNFFPVTTGNSSPTPCSSRLFGFMRGGEQ